MRVQGELINDNGTMAGGGNRQIRGLMRLGTAARVRADTHALQQEAQEAET